MDLLETHLYSEIGEAGFRRLVAAFYRRVPADEILGPMYAERDLSAAEGRLVDFLIQRFGGPADYSQRRGHPRLRMRHASFSIDQIARDRWMKLMQEAMAEVKLPENAMAVLRPFFEDTATFMMNRS